MLKNRFTEINEDGSKKLEEEVKESVIVSEEKENNEDILADEERLLKARIRTARKASRKARRRNYVCRL